MTSVDSVKVAKEIGKISARKGIVTDVLVEINIGEEASKFGLDPSELTETLRNLRNRLRSSKVLWLYRRFATAAAKFVNFYEYEPNVP